MKRRGAWSLSAKSARQRASTQNRKPEKRPACRRIVAQESSCPIGWQSARSLALNLDEHLTCEVLRILRARPNLDLFFAVLGVNGESALFQGIGTVNLFSESLGVEREVFLHAAVPEQIMASGCDGVTLIAVRVRYC